jgi:hypothetical protein
MVVVATVFGDFEFAAAKIVNTNYLAYLLSNSDIFTLAIFGFDGLI